MSEKADLLRELLALDLVRSSNNKINKKGAFLFVSFDLVNSTAFKSLYPNKWPVIFRRFYELVENHALKSFINSKVWRYAGDEILFYKQIDKISDLYDVPRIAHRVIKVVLEALNSKYAETKNLLFIKSTLWIAEATYVESQDLTESETILNNLIINFDIGQKRNVDFLGSDIDLGFRIAKFAQRDKVIISAELAYLLYKERGIIEEDFNYNVLDSLRIVTYEKLKGIWNDRHYPIIWYHESWDKPDEMFLYDEHFNSDIVKKIISKEFSSEMKIDRLKKIFTEVDNLEKVKSIETCMKQSEPINVLPSVSQYNQVEVHCVAVCFNNEGHILIAKRPSNKRRLPNIWEFGCGQLKKSQDFSDCLKESYKEDFGAELDFYSKLTPISTYIMEDKSEGRKIPGIIFIARVLNPRDVTDLYSRANHSEIKWFNPKDLSTIEKDDYVDDFAHTVSRAVEAFKSIHS
ncbi:NUDIX domain-containing protein [Priestia koreensis]|uniref:NUDIX domain-containing protein n=1 Tax=Priestia koreensis TaxID=284581 RepID=UPI0006A94B41|nr:NUDIX domain-containing protein [Priestia koreensis]